MWLLLHFRAKQTGLLGQRRSDVRSLLCARRWAQGGTCTVCPHGGFTHVCGRGGGREGKRDGCSSIAPVLMGPVPERLSPRGRVGDTEDVQAVPPPPGSPPFRKGVLGVSPVPPSAPVP